LDKGLPEEISAALIDRPFGAASLVRMASQQARLPIVRVAWFHRLVRPRSAQCPARWSWASGRVAQLEADRGPLSNACPSPGPSVISVAGGLGSAALVADVPQSSTTAPATSLRAGIASAWPMQVSN